MTVAVGLLLDTYGAGGLAMFENTYVTLSDRDFAVTRP